MSDAIRLDLPLGGYVIYDGESYRVMLQSWCPTRTPQHLTWLGHPGEVGGTGKSFWPPVHRVPGDAPVHSGIGLARQLGHPAAPPQRAASAPRTRRRLAA